MRLKNNLTKLIIDSFCKIEQRNERVQSIHLNPKHFIELKEELKYSFDLNTHKDSLEHGTIGALFGAEVYVSTHITKILLISDKSNFTISIDTSQTLETLDKKKKFRFIQ